MNTNTTKYFYGNEVSQYGIENGYVDYACLANCFEHVLCNNIAKDYGDTMFEVSGNWYDEEADEYSEIFQWYIVSINAVPYLQEAKEIVFYHEELDVYVWGVTHFGTGWDYVLTDIKIDW